MAQTFEGAVYKPTTLGEDSSYVKAAKLMRPVCTEGTSKAIFQSALDKAAQEVAHDDHAVLFLNVIALTQGTDPAIKAYARARLERLPDGGAEIKGLLKALYKD